MPSDAIEKLLERITQYLETGGLFNPEQMEHDKVRDLLIDCRDALVAISPAHTKPRPVSNCARQGQKDRQTSGLARIEVSASK